MRWITILLEINTLQYHSKALTTMLEVENEENLSKLGLSNSVHKSKVQSDDRMTRSHQSDNRMIRPHQSDDRMTRPHQTFTITFC